MTGLVQDVVTFGDERKQRPFGTREGQEYLVGGRAPPGPVDDLHLGGLQEIGALHQQIDILDGEFDRENAAHGRRIIGQAMMSLIETQK